VGHRAGGTLIVMSLVVCTGVGVAFGAEMVLHEVHLRLEARDRLAVVGANGAGKSSLLAVLAGTLEPTEGEVERRRGIRIGHLPQDAPEPVAGTLLGEVMASRGDLSAMRHELAVLEQRMAEPGAEVQPVLDRYGDVQHRYQDSGGYDLESRAREALGGLGLSDVEGCSPADLSGGQKRRVELAKLLVQDADLLLIDEPTNHLDLQAIEWLEGFMAGVGVAFVLVSHDRRFLDRVCTGVLELSQGTAEEYPGAFAHYVSLRGERRARRRKEWETQQTHIRHQEEFIRRYRAGQRAREARGRQKQLDRLPRTPAPVRDRRLRLRFSAAPRPNILLRTSAEVDIGRDGKVLVSLGRVTIAPGDRIAIVGANGTGKSTLLHTLAGGQPPLRGKVSAAAGLQRRLYRQDLRRGDEDVTPAHTTGRAAGALEEGTGAHSSNEAHTVVEGVTRAHAGDEAHTVLEDVLADHPMGADRGRNVLGALLFSGDDVHKEVGELSGGERARLLLGKLAMEETNLLLLDEPTNHLDIPAQEVLEEALLRYPGGVVLVTHDRALIDAVATETWALEEGRVRRVIGGYTDLVRDRQRQDSGGPEAPRPPSTATVRGRPNGGGPGPARSRAGGSDVARAGRRPVAAGKRVRHRPAAARPSPKAGNSRAAGSSRAALLALEADISAAEDALPE
ncbi:MAG: ABC-F family ATP-binding cassette domain-containing protein, partial [Candidatus Dormibacteria bacterium]